MVKVALDAGHGINTAGKRSFYFPDGSQMREYEFNMDVVERAFDLLKQDVRFTPLIVNHESRVTGEDIPLSTRVDRANINGCDLYISIHANAYGDNWNDANGFETWTRYGANDETVQIQKSLHYAILEKIVLKNRGEKFTDSFYVLNNTYMPSVLIEFGFMTNMAECSKLMNYTFRQLCAEGIYKGLINHYYYGGEEMEVRYKNLDAIPAWGKDAVEWALDNSILAGNGSDLDLTESELKTIVFLFRYSKIEVIYNG